jgi:hypothetical protein
MPGKSKHGKGKRYRASKKSKSLLRKDTVTSPAPAATAAAKPSAPIPATPAVKAATAPAGVISSQHAYVPGDLRRIGVLSAIVIVILFVLYFVLS